MSSMPSKRSQSRRSGASSAGCSCGSPTAAASAARRPRLTLLPARRRRRRPRPGGAHRLHDGGAFLPRRPRLDLPDLRRAVRRPAASECAHGREASKAPAAQRVCTRRPVRMHVGRPTRPRGTARPTGRPGPAGRPHPAGRPLQRPRAQDARPRSGGLVDRRSRQAARTAAPEHGRQRASLYDVNDDLRMPPHNGERSRICSPQTSSNTCSQKCQRRGSRLAGRTGSWLVGVAGYGQRPHDCESCSAV